MHTFHRFAYVASFTVLAFVLSRAETNAETNTGVEQASSTSYDDLVGLFSD